MKYYNEKKLTDHQLRKVAKALDNPIRWQDDHWEDYGALGIGFGWRFLAWDCKEVLQDLYHNFDAADVDAAVDAVIA